MRLQSNFALLDVKRGRVGLEKMVRKEPVPVTIIGEIIGVWGSDDGESLEFEVEVREVKTND